jgi:SAM-dependent methyltransferase
MNPHTLQALNQLNYQFYQSIGPNFDQTRQEAWRGWQKLGQHLQDHLPPGPLRLLDVGCGNGRFGAFLARPGWQLDYTGVDFNPYLLARAEDALKAMGLAPRLQEADLLSYEPQGPYDLIVIFGVLHHIPSFAARQALLARLFAQLRPGGLLALTHWAFYEHEGLRKRIIPWDSPQVPAALQGLDLEPGDYLLDWRGPVRALRYCHYVDEAEQARSLNAWPLITSFAADLTNRYALCQSPLLNASDGDAGLPLEG